MTRSINQVPRKRTPQELVALRYEAQGLCCTKRTTDDSYKRGIALLEEWKMESGWYDRNPTE
jgi:hypothetical protein